MPKSVNLASCRTIAATLTLLAAIALSSCNKNNESVSTSSQSTPNSSSTTSPDGANTPTSTSVAGTQGVAPSGTTCPNANPIKGVNSKRLGKIALTTNAPEYSSIKPEKCFPDTATAQNAGYKVPK